MCQNVTLTGFGAFANASSPHAVASTFPGAVVRPADVEDGCDEPPHAALASAIGARSAHNTRRADTRESYDAGDTASRSTCRSTLPPAPATEDAWRVKREARVVWLLAVVGLVGALAGCGGTTPQQATTSTAATVSSTTSTSATSTTNAPTTTAAPRPEGWEVLPPSPIGLGLYGIWTGHEYIGGERGCCDDLDGTQVVAYTPSTQQWRRLSPFPLPARRGEVAAWTGHEMVVVGGAERPDPKMTATVPTATGAALDPSANRWRVIAPMPAAMSNPIGAAWTGSLVVVFDNTRTYLYDPATDRWRVGAAPPFDRAFPTVVWDGHELLVWSGRDTGAFSTRVYADGAAYNPTTDRWREIPAAPVAPRWLSAAVWTGHEMFVWGGTGATVDVGQPAAYNPTKNTWRKLPLSPLRARTGHQMVWTGREVVIWGGRVQTSSPDPNAALPHDGAAFDPATNSWRKLPPTPSSPATPVDTDTAVWTGQVVIFGGGWTTESEGDGPLGLAYAPGR